MILKTSAILTLTGIQLTMLMLGSSAIAQVPRAQAVDPVLAGDSSNDLFLRGKNIYESAQAATDLANRTEYYRRAAMIFSDYLNLFSDNPRAEQAWWYLGNSHYQSGMIDDARRCFSTLINRYGRGKWVAAAAYTLAADHYNRGEYAFAAPMFERYAANTEKPEERARGNYLAGNSYRMLGRNREAIGSLRRVIEDPAGSHFAPQAKTALGQLHAADGKFQEALALFEEVLATDATPKVRGEAALGAALAAAKLGRSADSDRHLFLILKSSGMEDFRAEAQTVLMSNAFERKDYREVVRIYRSSESKASGEKEGTRLMIAARAHLRMKSYAEALPLFREVERIAKADSELAFDAAYHRLLCFFQVEGQFVTEQVDAFLQLYKKSRPKDARIHTAMMMKAEALFSKKDAANAAKIYSQVDSSLLSAKNLPGFLYQRAWCLAEAGDHSGAVRSFDEFITRFPKDSRVASAIAKRAWAHAELSEPRKALADYDQLIANSPAGIFLRVGSCLIGAAKHDPVDEVHHVEGRPVHRFVVAVADHRGDRDRGPVEGRDHLDLAAHVVGGTERLAERRPAEDPPPSGPLGDQEGQVREPAVDRLIVEGGLGRGNPLFEPGPDRAARYRLLLDSHRLQP